MTGEPLAASLDAFGAARLFVSAVMLLLTSIAVARRLGPTWADRYWIAIAAAAAQVGTICVVLSPARALTPAGFLLAQLVIAAAAVGWALRFDEADALPWPRWKPVAATPARKLLLAYVGFFLAIGLMTAIVLPVNTFDDRMYRASRAAYWLQHSSLLPWTTHNPRQTAFPFGSELAFFWPVLLTRCELPGRLAFFGGTLLLAAGTYAVTRQARVPRTAALAGLLLLLSTPAVLFLQEGLHPELWVAVFALGAAHFALRAADRRNQRVARHLAWVGFFVALAVNAKTTALAMAPGALALPFVIPAATGRRWPGVVSVMGGAVAGVLLSGLALTMTMNLLRDGRALGPPGMTTAHTAERSFRSMRTHVARFVVDLIDLPAVPSMEARQRVAEFGYAILRLFRADQPLPGEDPEARWPGPYYFGVGRYASRYSVGGLVWLPALAAACVLAARQRHARRLLAQLALAGPLLAGSILVVRWMGLMERFWVPPYALSVPIIVIVVHRLARRWRWVGPVAVGVLLLTALPVIWRRAETVVGWAAMPPSQLMLQEPFRSPLRQMPAGSRILLVAHSDVRDYALFLPHDRFANHVVSWGRSPFDPQLLRRMLDDHAITHVLVQDDEWLSMHWDPPLDTTEMVGWLTRQSALREVSAGSPGMRLFIRSVPSLLPSTPP